MTTMPARPRLYLVTPSLGETAPFTGAIDAVLSATDVAAVLLRLEGGNEHALIDRTKAIAEVVQRRNVALLLDGNVQIVARANADGAHLTGIAALNAAIGRLKPDRIVGAGGLRSRDDAMLAGEAGADYVMFGEPDREGGRPHLSAVLERLAWWAGLFVVPCVGYAASLDEAAALASANADFVALGEWIWTHARGPVVAVVEANQRLAETLSSLERSGAEKDVRSRW